jgi:UDP-N-acetylmuramoylalanine--D-glutamate ligase
MELNGKQVVVVGLARTGVSVARFLAARGARVTVTDMKPADALQDHVDALAGLDLQLQLGGHDLDRFRTADLVVVSPGVPMDVPPLAAAREGGGAVISEIELASRFIAAPIVAITGTNGKTTTTTLTGEIFRAAGRATFVGGNIGNPLMDLPAGGGTTDVVVAEISSFQLEGIESFRPRVSVLLNITEDHLDRYASYQEYIDAKARIFMNQTADDWAVLNADDPLVAPFADSIAPRAFLFSQRQELAAGAFCLGEEMVFRHDGREWRFPVAGFRLKGVHNIDNIMAAVAGALLMGIDPDEACRAIAGFPGLPHRMEYVATLDGVDYYNDSKGTNVGSVVRSLESFPPPIILIAGGKDKGGDYTPIAQLVRERVSHLLLIGEAKEKIRTQLGHLCDTRLAESLEEAVVLARSLALPGTVVLFSPACSSFDMFKNYEERGNRFAEAVRGQGGEGC